MNFSSIERRSLQEFIKTILLWGVFFLVLIFGGKPVSADPLGLCWAGDFTVTRLYSLGTDATQHMNE